MNSTVVTSVPREGVQLISLNRPERLNALNPDLVAALNEALASAAASSEIRVVVLTGNGRGFCAGWDLTSNAARSESGPPPSTAVVEVMESQEEIADVVRTIHTMPQPVIAAINGPAAGGGLALACASDIRIASTGAVLAVSFIRAGFSGCDIGVSWLLPRIVGTGRAHELMLTGRRFSAEDALNYGFVTDVVAPADLLDAALAKAEEIMLNPPWSVELTKQGMWHGVESSSFASTVMFENRQQVLANFSRDRHEAAAAFLEKRPPNYVRG